MIMQDVIIAEGVRTPIGDFGGQFKGLLANDLAVITIKEAMQRSDTNYDEVDEVILGNCIQRTDEPNLGRTAALKAGLPKETTGFTIQRQCSSGMQAVVVSLGHTVGSTGARIILTLLKEMHRRENKYGLATLCVGGGMGMAVVVEKL